VARNVAGSSSTAGIGTLQPSMKVTRPQRLAPRTSPGRQTSLVRPSAEGSDGPAAGASSSGAAGDVAPTRASPPRPVRKAAPAKPSPVVPPRPMLLSRARTSSMGPGAAESSPPPARVPAAPAQYPLQEVRE
jgi:hypothetical protein